MILNVEDVDVDLAREMADVGIVPSTAGPETEPVGHCFLMAGQLFKITGYATRKEFLTAVAKSGRSPVPFMAVPDGMFFQRISTD